MKVIPIPNEKRNSNDLEKWHLQFHFIIVNIKKKWIKFKIERKKKYVKIKINEKWYLKKEIYIQIFDLKKSLIQKNWNDAITRHWIKRQCNKWCIKRSSSGNHWNTV